MHAVATFFGTAMHCARAAVAEMIDGDRLSDGQKVPLPPPNLLYSRIDDGGERKSCDTGTGIYIDWTDVHTNTYNWPVLILISGPDTPVIR